MTAIWHRVDAVKTTKGLFHLVIGTSLFALGSFPLALGALHLVEYLCKYASLRGAGTHRALTPWLPHLRAGRGCLRLLHFGLILSSLAMHLRGTRRGAHQG